MSSTPPLIVQITVVNGLVTVTQSPAPVTQANTYLSFQLLIPGIKFVDTNSIDVDAAYKDSFVGPWKVSDNNATLLDKNLERVDEISYTVNVIALSGGKPYALTTGIIKNSGPE